MLWFKGLLEATLGEVFCASPTGRRPQKKPRSRWRVYFSQLAWEPLGILPEDLTEVAGRRKALASLLRLLHP